MYENGITVFAVQCGVIANPSPKFFVYGRHISSDVYQGAEQDVLTALGFAARQILLVPSPT